MIFIMKNIVPRVKEKLFIINLKKIILNNGEIFKIR
tara:strand:+ start:557 stop:664 length:108 start_codon:yes stop_codon:yes gene_type:complete